MGIFKSTTLGYRNLRPFSTDSTVGFEDGRFMLVIRFPLIVALDIRTGESWQFTNESVKLIFGFTQTIGNKGILLYSPHDWPEFALSRQLLLANVEFDFDTSLTKLIDSSSTDSEDLLKDISHEGDQFVLLSEKSSMRGSSISSFHIYSISDINKPLKKLSIEKINSKILFYNFINGEIFFFDTPQVCLFEDIFKKLLIRRLCVKSGIVTTIKTSNLPDCDKYISYGNQPWNINGKWCQRTLYLTITLPFSSPEIHLFSSTNIDTCQWRQIIIDGLPSVRKLIIKPGQRILEDDRASLLINILENQKMIILQPRNWDHTELACFSVILNHGNPDKLRVLSRKTVLENWPELGEMKKEELSERNLPSNLFPTFNMI